MAKKDPETEARRTRFRDYCRERGWEKPDGTGWFTTEIAKAIGKPVNKTSDLLNGYGSFGAHIAREIEEALLLPRGFFDGIGETDDFAEVAHVEINLSAGHGAQPEFYESVGSLKFKRSFLRSIGVSPANAKVVDVKGRSMDPTIKDGSVLLISTSNKEPMHDQFFALARPGDDLLVKRLVKLQDGSWVARSDNRDPAYPDIRIDHAEPIFIVGRAVWMGVRL